MSLEKIASNKAFDGEISKYKFKSDALGGLDTQINVFLPSEAKSQKVPVLWYLAGLTCNEDTGAWKGGFIRDAAQEGIALIFPDTSPRGAGIEGEDSDWDFGTGAGFYIDATSEKFRKHYNMYTHITSEIPQVLSTAGLPLDFNRQAIFGHSMGGHGAITIYLRSPNRYRSASAFAPILNPTQCPWGKKAFAGYLKGGLEEGKASDATELISKSGGQPLNILIDYGEADKFLADGQLLPENFLRTARQAGFGEDQIEIRPQPGYDHSYYFISTFAGEHVRRHGKFLKA